MLRRDEDGRIGNPSYEDLTGPDAIIVRTMPPGSLEQVVFRMDALMRLEAEGVTIVNPPKAIECAVDKYLATTRLASAGLPVPENDRLSRDGLRDGSVLRFSGATSW